jgi:hypothetical protein
LDSAEELFLWRDAIKHEKNRLKFPYRHQISNEMMTEIPIRPARWGAPGDQKTQPRDRFWVISRNCLARASDCRTLKTDAPIAGLDEYLQLPQINELRALPP